jgi:hypothetical protein
LVVGDERAEHLSGGLAHDLQHVVAQAETARQGGRLVAADPCPGEDRRPTPGFDG